MTTTDAEDNTQEEMHYASGPPPAFLMRAEPPTPGSRRLNVRISAAARASADAYAEMAARPQPSAPRFADLWSTLPTPPGEEPPAEDVDPRIVVFLGVGASFNRCPAAVPARGEVRVAPVSTETVFSTNYDLLVAEAMSPLPFGFMVEGWNEVGMLGSQLGRWLGSLHGPLAIGLENVVTACRAGTAPDPEVTAGLVGTPLMGDRDPRRTFQVRERRACEYLRWPLRDAPAGHRPAAARQSDVDRADPTDPDPEPPGAVAVSGPALRRAREKLGWKLSDVAAALHGRGHAVAVKWLFALEQEKTDDAPPALVRDLAASLGVAPDAIRRAGAGGGPRADVVRYLAGQRFAGLARTWAERMGMSNDDFRTWAGGQLAGAHRRAAGDLPEDELEGWLLGILRSGSA